MLFVPSLVAECCLDLLCSISVHLPRQEGEHQGELNREMLVPTAPAAAQPGEKAMSIGPSIAPTPQTVEPIHMLTA